MDDFGPDLGFIFDDASGLMDFDVLNSFKIHETKDSKNNLNGEKEDHETALQILDKDLFYSHNDLFLEKFQDNQCQFDKNISDSLPFDKNNLFSTPHNESSFPDMNLRSNRITSREKLERSRQSARDCRARKRLKYGYLESMIKTEEKDLLEMSNKLNEIGDWATKSDNLANQINQEIDCLKEDDFKTLPKTELLNFLESTELAKKLDCEPNLVGLDDFLKTNVDFTADTMNLQSFEKENS